MEISEAEWEIMRVVWANHQATSSYILEVLSQKMEWKNSTVKTLLSRLVQKNYLKTEKEGNKFIYQATLTENQAIENKMQHLLSQTCSKKIGHILIDTLDQVSLSQQDIERLLMLLQEKQKSAPININCDCIVGQCTCQN